MTFRSFLVYISKNLDIYFIVQKPVAVLKFENVKIFFKKDRFGGLLKKSILRIDSIF